MPGLCRKNIGYDTKTWSIHRTSIEQVSGRWAGDPTSQGSGWTNSEEFSSSGSSKHPLTWISAALESGENRSS